MSALMAGLDDEIRGLAQAILARPSPDLAHVGADRINYAVDRCLLRLERLRLDERADWVAAEILAAEGRGERDNVTRLLDLQRQTNESRRPSTARSNRRRSWCVHEPKATNATELDFFPATGGH